MHGLSTHACSYSYLISSLFGSGFNLAVWQVFIRPPNLNDANNYSFRAIVCIAATAFCQIKITLTTITVRFAKY